MTTTNTKGGEGEEKEADVSNKSGPTSWDSLKHRDLKLIAKICA